MNTRQCLNEKCRFWHLKGTRRYPEDQSSNEVQQNPQFPPQFPPPSFTTRIPNSSPQNDFLGQMRAQMNKDMTAMKEQQQMFMQQMNHQFCQVMNRLKQDPPTPQVHPNAQPQSQMYANAVYQNAQGQVFVPTAPHV